MKPRRGDMVFFLTMLRVGFVRH